MKNPAKHIFIYVLLFAVFISGNGIVLGIHTCLSGSVKYVTLFKPKSCCDKDKECEKEDDCKSNQVGSNCCTSQTTYLKISSSFLNKKIEKLNVDVLVSTRTFETIFNAPFHTVYSRFIPPSFSISIPTRPDQLLI